MDGLWGEAYGHSERALQERSISNEIGHSIPDLLESITPTYERTFSENLEKLLRKQDYLL